MSFNPRGGRGGYSRRGYRGSMRGSYRSGNPPDRFSTGGMLKVNRGSHYESSDNRYVPGESSNGTRSPEHRPKKFGTTDSKPTSGLNTPISITNVSVSTPKRNDIIVTGTDKTTGINEKDSEFTKLAHHSDFTSLLPSSRPADPRKNFKVLHDSKTNNPQSSKKVRYNGEGISQTEVIDPRSVHMNQYLHKPNKKSKKFPYTQLLQPKIVYDKDSLGLPPLSTIVLWDLPISTNESYLRNFLARYGNSVEEIQFVTDPSTAVPLGVVSFKFQGTPENSSIAAKKFIKTVRSDEPRIDGVALKAALNDHDNQLLNRKIEASQQKLLQQRLKREEDEKKRQKAIEEQEKLELLKKKAAEEEEAKKREEQQGTKNDDTMKSTRIKNVTYKPDQTVLSIKHKHKIVPGVILPKDLEKYIKNRCYLLIHDKYVPTKKVSSQDIKRLLKKYDWTRVLSDKTGFYIVFNSLNECERCFFNEDNTKFFEYRIVMELAIPPGFTGDNKEELKSTSDVLDEATNILVKEFQTFLAKDIRERIIAPTILDLLGHEHYPELVQELKAQEQQTIKPKIIVSNNHLKQNAMTILEKQKQKLQERLKRKAQLVPMQHALDDDYESHSESESQDEEEDEEDEEEEDDEEEVESGTLTPQTMKRERSSTITSIEEDALDLQEHIAKKPKIEDEEDKMDIEPAETVIDIKYEPTTGIPQPVYLESTLSGVFDLDALQDTLKDTEDLVLAQEVLQDTVPSTIKNIDYWSWKLKDIKNAEEITGEDDEIEELSVGLESTTGSFKSEGYRKIPEADKIGYLPHRRKADKPIKTIQYEDDEDEKMVNENTNAGQSSRVNRANNRRFAADITAQIGSESDVLSLNALTKRKKPVTFARSAIHNWGLYAMEPIAAKEMIIEYVGERIRQQVAEHREKSYLKTGIGSSYLFRIDENTVIDATKKGGIARFINHCCSPSCTAKIIKVEGKKRIVIYALRDIEANEELTYDYKFERETNDEERIRCLCGAPGCKGYLN
ncbi:SET1 Histone-lysine N-methyltransferase [Candida maltosa Xu316]